MTGDHDHAGAVSSADLWPLVVQRSQRAQALGAQIPLDFRMEILREADIEFVVRVVRENPRARTAAVHQPADPFLPPYDPELFLGAVSATHVAILNKFNVLPHHLLLVTRDYEDQEAWLSRADFEALLIGLQAVQGLAFYNAGAAAGASQPHKHLQLVELPLGGSRVDLPLAPALAPPDEHFRFWHSPRLPFPHVLARMRKQWIRRPGEGAAALHALYRELIAEAGLATDTLRQSAPYNLLASCEYLWLVPRSRGLVDGIPVNALAFAGALLARGEAQLELIRKRGPIRILSDAATEF